MCVEKVIRGNMKICVLLAQKSNSNLFDPCLPPRVPKMGCKFGRDWMKPTGVMEGKWKNVCRKSDQTICVLLAQKSNSNLFDPCLPPRVLKMGCKFGRDWMKPTGVMEGKWKNVCEKK